MYRASPKGREGGRYQDRKEIHYPRKKSKTHYFETDASFETAVMLRPVPQQLRWKFARSGLVDYTRYELSIVEQNEMNPSQHDNNLRDTEKIVDQTLREVFKLAPSFQLSCQARVGKAVWLGDLIEHSVTDAMRLQLHQFKGPPRFINRRPHLKNEFYTRASVIEHSIMGMLEQLHGAHDVAQNSLQIAITNNMPGGEVYYVTVCKNPGAELFEIQRIFRSNRFLQKATSDLVCLERFHDLRITTSCFERENLLVEQLPDSHNFMMIMNSIVLSEDGRLQMILQSGQFQVEYIRMRRICVFRVARENDWRIRYTRLGEYPIPVDYAYTNDVVVQLGNGNDNKELEVSLDRNIDRNADIRRLVKEIRRLIEFSLELVKLSDYHLGL